MLEQSISSETPDLGDKIRGIIVYSGFRIYDIFFPEPDLTGIKHTKKFWINEELKDRKFNEVLIRREYYDRCARISQ